MAFRAAASCRSAARPWAAWPSIRSSRSTRAAGVTGSHKAIINIYLPGGPPHMDMWDLKPDAPAEIRGEFKPISTNVPGIEICELFPKIAAMMDKFAIIRSLADSDGDHDAYQCMTGRKKRERPPGGGWPSAGGWVSQLAGPANEAVPPNLALMYPTGNRGWGEPGDGGFPGTDAQPVQRSSAASRARSRRAWCCKASRSTACTTAIACVSRSTASAATPTSPAAWRASTPSRSRPWASSPTSKLGDALDLSKEDPKILERYGKSDEGFRRDGAPRMVENFCIARRLVEAGARYVALNFSRWDWHGGDGMNFVESQGRFPAARSGPVGAGHRPARARAGQGRLGRRLGRVRPHAEAQQDEQPRPLAARSTPRSWPAAACAPARSSARPTSTPKSPSRAR